MARPQLFSLREQPFGTQYSEVKQRALASQPTLAGTPGFLKAKEVNGSMQVYRIHQDGAGRRVEDYVAPAAAIDRVDAMRARIEEAQWIQRQISKLRALGFQVSDKVVGEVLLAFSNQGAFDAGLVLVGTIAVMSWMNEMGIEANTSMTRDVDLARRRHVSLATPISFLDLVKSTGLGFTPVPGMPSHGPSTSVKRPGIEGLKVDLLAPGPELGKVLRIPELNWTAETVPHFDWLLEETDHTCILAGGHCIPVRVPAAARLAWHKFYSSTQRFKFQDKAVKDRSQAMMLTSVLADREPHSLVATYRTMPAAMRKHVDAVVDRENFGSASGLMEEVMVRAREPNEDDAAPADPRLGG